ncbi:MULTISPECIES: MFS transporter [Gammaproteobacteria]|uniref:MFS transporter n=1 Tax=Gammaproteobacteria TaxID=1236 RepID=UPI000DCF8507|nr:MULTISPECIES: MFS transporter [Gammaproteobacteria]RTE85747.1 MFS transporter [Aliidiomarina sp. B3213]TCZ90251.1 MFS transporter [Lysobacter sp. N42]
MNDQNRAWTTRVYRYLVDEEDARVCRDIPDEACNAQPKSFVLHILALVLTKLGDSLVSARLILPWLMTASGAPGFLIAWLVPLRESMALLPQLLVAQKLREQPIRKWFWVIGSLGQCVGLIAMLLAVLYTEGTVLGWSIIGALLFFSLSRGVCSVAIKDVMGKTISKSRRGRLTGNASSAAGVLTLLVALLIIAFPELTESSAVFYSLLGGSALLWLVAATIYSFVPETPGATEGGGNAGAEAIKSLSLLVTDSHFRKFVMTRALLVSSAFSIPYIVVLVQQQDQSTLSTLGGLMLASGAAGMVAGRFWGSWADKASHHVMAAAAWLASAIMVLTVVLASFNAALLGNIFVASALIFSAAVAHQGARIGRTTYLVDMATQENRAQFTAVSNTLIGVILLCGGVLGALDYWLGTLSVLVFLALLAILAGGQALRLPSVSESND